MNPFKLLIVEDNPQDRQTCRDSVARYEAQKQQRLAKALQTVRNGGVASL